jgi:hypothetical protein
MNRPKMEFGGISDNPFSLVRPPVARRRRAFVSACKFLILVVICLAATVAIGSYSRTWLAARLVADFHTLDADQKQTRLIQLADLGVAGITPLVGALADQDLGVARAAYELLQEMQNRWTVLTKSEQQRHHRVLVESLGKIAVELPPDRTGWGTNLLQQTVLLSVDRDDDSSRRLYHSASQALDILSLSDRATPTVAAGLDDQPLDRDEPRRLVVRSRPLTVTSDGQADPWTDWPPPVENAGRVNTQQTGRVAAAPRQVVERAAAVAVGPQSGSPPTVYRSGVTEAGRAPKLQRVSEDQTRLLRDVAENRETAYRSQPIQPVAPAVASPLEAMDDQSVMKWLGSPHTALREQARAELVSRGLGESEIAIATQIAVSDTPARLALIDAIARSDAFDPRPWLLMLLEDQNPQVKLKTIAVLATMQDAYIDQRLRNRLSQEPDTKVASQIRRVLSLR